MDQPELRQLGYWTAWGVRPEALPLIAEQLAKSANVEARGFAAAGDIPISKGVGVIPLRGLITPQPSLISLLFGGGGGGLRGFRQSLREALANDEVDSILIDVDSPGGSTDLLTETAAEIRAAREIKPITAIANTTAASAAYWLAAQASELIVTPSGEVGSIGVYAIHWDESGLNEQLGVTPTLISAGKHKTDGNPFEPLSDDAKATLQQTIDEFYDLFVNDVAAGRGVPVADVVGGFGEGRLLTARNAVTEGLADDVASFEDTVARLSGATPPGRMAAAGAVGRLASSSESQSGDKPDPNEPEGSEEEKARIARVLVAHPDHY